MDKQQLISDLTTKFDASREAFLSAVRGECSSFIAGQGSGCLTLIERKNHFNFFLWLISPFFDVQPRWQTNEVWTLSANPQYVLRLIAFCRGTTYDGNVIDSALTEPVVEIVTRRFEALYQSKDEDIAKAIITYVVQDKVLCRGLVEAVIGSAAVGHAAGAVKEKVAALIIDQLKEVMHTGAAKAVVATVGKSVAAIAAKPIGTQIALLLMKFIALNLKTVIAKVLASAAIKGMIAGAVKKFLMVAVGAAIVKAVAAKFGISAAAVWLWFLIPVIAAFLIYEIATFPRHLAEKVSDKVVEDLRGSYAKINDDVFERIVTEVVEAGMGVLVGDLGKRPEVQDAIQKLAAAVA